MVDKVIHIAEHRPLVSHRNASTTAANLLITLSDCESPDIIGALQFDLTPVDIAVIETFTGLVRERTQARLRREKDKNERSNHSLYGSERPA